MQKNKKTLQKKISIRRFFPIYLMAVPALIYLLVNNYFPLTGLVVAFKDFNYRDGIFGSPWCWFDNFKYLFATKTSWIITRNTILYNLVFIVVNTIVSVTVAILLNEIRKKFVLKAFQIIILLPYLLSMIIISYLVYAFLCVDTGFINSQVLSVMGLEPIQWYSEPEYWPFILIFVNTLKNFGFLSIIYYASVISIDNGYYEAALVDGANKFRQIRYITIPHLIPTIIVMVLLAVGKIFYSDFGLFYQVTQNSGAIYSVTNTIDTFVYRGLVQLGDIGMSAAAGLYQSVVGFILVMLANHLVRKISPENALF